MPAPLSRIHRVALALGAAAALVGLGATARRAPAGDPGVVVRNARPLMGTVFQVSIWTERDRAPQAAEAALDALNQAAALEARISTWRPDSEASRLNAAAGREPVEIGADLADLLRLSVRWSAATDGSFDVTGGPLFELWEEARKGRQLPAAEAIARARRLVGASGIELAGGTAFLRRAGMRVGFGAIGKGFAADRLAASLRARGFGDFLIDAGGDLMIGGSRGPTPWTVGVRHPRRQNVIGLCRGTEYAVATSGDYERYMLVGERRFSHIVDLRTGWPAEQSAGVTVLARSAADADALATAVSVLGAADGLRVIESLPEVDALVVDMAGTLRLSSGLELRGDELVWHRAGSGSPGP